MVSIAPSEIKHINDPEECRKEFEKICIERKGRKGPMKIVLPFIQDNWSDGELDRVSLQIWLLAGVNKSNLNLYIHGSQGLIYMDIRINRNMLNHKRAFAGF